MTFSLPARLTPVQLKTAGAALLVLLLLYYLVVQRPSLAWSYYVLGKARYKDFGAPFLQAWAKARQQSAASFQFENKNYLTSTGQAQR